MNRRSVLATGAACAVILGMGGVRLSRDAPSVREPWTQAGTGFGDPRLDALAYAILAPSAHNRQPWIFRLDGASRVTILPDLARLLPQTDPYNRQIVISFGSLIELLRMAAEAGGHTVSVTPFPDGEPQPELDGRPVAHVDFAPAPMQTDPLMDALLDRRTNRAAFSDRDIDPATIETVLSEADGRAGMFADGSAIRDVCRESWKIENDLPRTHEESVALTRIGAREVRANPDGISLYGPMMEALSAVGVFNRDAMRTPGSTAHAQSYEFYDRLIQSGRSFLYLRSDANSREDQLRAGRDWVRLNLAATRAGLGFHPLSQCLQEFPEMDTPFQRAHALAGMQADPRGSGPRLQGIFRIGYAANPRPSPRWPLQSRLEPVS